MKPGRELDIAVGRKVMGDQGLAVLIPEYSTDIAVAWRVVEKMAEAERYMTIHLGPTSIDDYPVYFVDVVNPVIQTRVTGTAPHGICLAALAAVEGKP